MIGRKSNRFITFSVIIVLISVLLACNNSYTIKHERLRLPYKIDHRFGIYKLKVNEFDKDGFPLVYDTVISVYCNPNSSPTIARYNERVPDSIIKLKNDLWEKIHSDLFLETDSFNNIDSIAIEYHFLSEKIIAEYFSFEPQRIIYLNKTNKNYWWSIDSFNIKWNDFEMANNNYLNNKGIDVFPMKFENMVWYKISLSNETFYDDDIYFMFNNKKMKSIRKEGYHGDAW